MKRLIALLIVAVLAFGLMTAYAEVDVEQALKKLSDDDLFILQYYLLMEMRSRGLDEADNSLLSTLGLSGTSSATTVWVTKSGTKYHRFQTCGNTTCVREMTLAEALSEGYAPCGRCNPPTK